MLSHATLSAVALVLITAAVAQVTIERLDASAPIATPSPIAVMGNATNPASGVTLSIDSQSFRLNGVATLPVSGEIHYTRMPVTEWRTSLLAMKSGGLTTINCYVFWIHHEEANGTWHWEGNHNLTAFLTVARDVGLSAVVRAGPWAHGEVRNGGHPDWLLKVPGIKVRSTQALYMSYVQRLYAQIAGQLRGLYWSDGGPVIGLQLDNEYKGSYTYLAALKALAISVGINVPYFVKTGWPTEPAPMGLFLPMESAYCDGFWDRVLHPVASYSDVYLFANLTDANTAAYPVLGVEVGGRCSRRCAMGVVEAARDAGMELSYQGCTLTG